MIELRILAADLLHAAGTMKIVFEKHPAAVTIVSLRSEAPDWLVTVRLDGPEAEAAKEEILGWLAKGLTRRTGGRSTVTARLSGAFASARASTRGWHWQSTPPRKRCGRQA